MFFSRHTNSSSGQFEHVEDADVDDDETLIISRDENSTLIAQSASNGSEEDSAIHAKSTSTGTVANMSTAQLLTNSRQSPESSSSTPSASKPSTQLDGNNLLNISHKQKRAKAKNDHAKYDLVF